MNKSRVLHYLDGRLLTSNSIKSRARHQSGSMDLNSKQNKNTTKSQMKNSKTKNFNSRNNSQPNLPNSERQDIFQNSYQNSHTTPGKKKQFKVANANLGDDYTENSSYKSQAAQLQSKQSMPSYESVNGQLPQIRYSSVENNSVLRSPNAQYEAYDDQQSQQSQKLGSMLKKIDIAIN